ncbi:MAG: ribose-phosphate diphosphokinase [Chloroflexota bacterium]
MSRLYDQLAIFGGNSNPELSREICSYIDIPPGRMDAFKFSNENIFVRIGESVRENDVFVIQSLSGKVNENIMELLIIIDTLKRASAGRITAVIPYYGYGRTDKKDQPRVPITARLIADMITVAGANRVLTMDLHAGQLQGFFNVPVDEMTALPTLADYFTSMNLSAPVVVAPDLGSTKRARNFAEDIDASLAVIEKRRVGDAERNEVLNLIGTVEGRPVVIIDDEIDTAGSIVQAAQLCLENGATEVYAACTHPVLSGPAIERLDASPIKELVISNTIPIPKEKMIDKITVLSVAPILGESIQRIHTGTSVSSAYRSADRTPMP